MKRICFFVILFLIAGITAKGQFSKPVLLPLSARVVDSLKMYPVRLVPENLYSSQLAFFCRQELRVEKLLKVPVRFRLGSVEYTDRLEGKRTTILSDKQAQRKHP